MNKETIINNTLQAIQILPEEKANEIAVFADFMLQKYQDEKLIDSIQKITSASESFSFLYQEEDLYSIADLKEKYNG